MSFLDRVISIANSLGKRDPEQPDLLDGLIKLVQEKGVSGIVQDLKTRGLGDIASSWVGPGDNKPINTEQIKAALGNEKLQTLAQKAGISPENAAKFFQEVLPGLIDRLTPEGKVPDDDAGQASPE